jgi:hypothetical protein
VCVCVRERESEGLVTTVSYQDGAESRWRQTLIKKVPFLAISRVFSGNFGHFGHVSERPDRCFRRAFGMPKISKNHQNRQNMISAYELHETVFSPPTLSIIGGGCCASEGGDKGTFALYRNFYIAGFRFFFMKIGPKKGKKNSPRKGTKSRRKAPRSLVRGRAAAVGGARCGRDYDCRQGDHGG